MRRHCIILSLMILLASHHMALLFPRPHLTVPVLACSQASLVTGAMGATHSPACIQALVSLHLGSPSPLCQQDCLHPTQVLRTWEVLLASSFSSISQLCCSSFRRRHGGFDQQPVGEHIHSTCLHQKSKVFFYLLTAHSNTITFKLLVGKKKSTDLTFLCPGLLHFNNSACHHLFSHLCLHICVSLSIHLKAALLA